jgi:hypothetical protein
MAQPMPVDAPVTTTDRMVFPPFVPRGQCRGRPRQRNAVRFSSRAPMNFFETSAHGKKAQQMSVLKMKRRANVAQCA